MIRFLTCRSLLLTALALAMLPILRSAGASALIVGGAGLNGLQGN